MSEPTSKERENRAWETVRAYSHRHPDHLDDGNLYEEELITDLLADLRHHCHANGIDFEMCARMAETYFAEEEVDQ